MAARPSTMLKLLDRYLIREVLLPFFIVLVVLSFLLEIPVILQQGEKLIEKGVEWHIVAHVLLTLLPQALALTIPCAVLVGILVAFGRLSGDREFVAMQACGISIFRLLRPIALFSALATAATLYVTIVALPDANQSFREITFNVVASQAESDIKPRVFFTAFPNRVLYVRDQSSTGGWHDVFLADATRPDQTTVYFASEGRLLVDRARRSVQLALTGGTSHTTFTAKPDEYEGKAFDSSGSDDGSGGRLSARRAHERRSRDDDRRAAGERRGRRATWRPRLRSAVHDPSEVRLGRRVRGSRPARADPRRQQPEGRPACEFRDRVRRHLRLLHPPVDVARRSADRTSAGDGRRGSRTLSWAIAGIGLLFWRARSADQPIRISIPTFWRRVSSALRSGRCASHRRAGTRRRRHTRAAPEPAPAESPGHVHVRELSARFRARVRRPARHFLHLDVHGSRRQAVSRQRDDRHAASATSIS